jgi:hypothetical protein
MILSAEIEDKIRSELYDSDHIDVGRRLLGPMWNPRDRTPVPNAADVVSFLAPMLVDVLAYDGTRGNTSRGRQSGFWARTEHGLEPIEISEVVAALDRVLRPMLADAILARDMSPPSKNEPSPKAVRVRLIEALRKALTSPGNFRGQLVAALRDSGEFDFSKADYASLVADCPPGVLVQFAGLVRSVKAP